MSIPNIIFLAAICLGYGVFMVTLGAAAWYCRDSLTEHRRPTSEA
jgi:hypothetical protein